MNYNVGDIVQVVHNAAVLNNGADGIEVQTTDGKFKFTIKGQDLLNSLSSADSFSSTQNLAQTNLIDQLLQSNGKVFTVEFAKANGELRKLRGFFLKEEPKLGRSYVHDLDVKKGTPVREVDHRTLRSIIIGGTKFVSKKK